MNDDDYDDPIQTIEREEMAIIVARDRTSREE